MRNAARVDDAYAQLAAAIDQFLFGGFGELTQYRIRVGVSHGIFLHSGDSWWMNAGNTKRSGKGRSVFREGKRQRSFSDSL